MASPKNWVKTDNSAGQWNSLVTDVGSVLSAVLLSNTSAGAITVQIRLATTGGVLVATILPAHTISGYGADVINLQSLVIPTGQQLQVYTSSAALHAVGSGAL